MTLGKVVLFASIPILAGAVYLYMQSGPDRADIVALGQAHFDQAVTALQSPEQRNALQGTTCSMLPSQDGQYGLWFVDCEFVTACGQQTWIRVAVTDDEAPKFAGGGRLEERIAEACPAEGG